MIRILRATALRGGCVKTIKEYLDENKLIYGNHGHLCKKSVKARLRKQGKIRKMLEGTTFDEPMIAHGNTRLTKKDKRVKR